MIFCFPRGAPRCIFSLRFIFLIRLGQVEKKELRFMPGLFLFWGVFFLAWLNQTLATEFKKSDSALCGDPASDGVWCGVCPRRKTL